MCRKRVKKIGTNRILRDKKTSTFSDPILVECPDRSFVRPPRSVNRMTMSHRNTMQVFIFTSWTEVSLRVDQPVSQGAQHLLTS